MTNEFKPDWNENAVLTEEILRVSKELEQTKKDFLMQTDAAMDLLDTADRARGLLERCLDEMQYAGWNQPMKDNPNRWSVFSAVLNYLHPPVKGEKHMSTPFNEHWLEMGACVPVDIETTAILLDEIKQLRHDARLEKQWVGLTDDDMQDVIQHAMHSITGGDNTFTLSANKVWVAIVREVEAKLKERNS